MKFFLTVALLIGLLLACQPPASKTDIAVAPIDLLLKTYFDSWNHHDSAAVSTLFADDIFLSDDEHSFSNLKELTDHWIHPNINMVNNLTASQLQAWSTDSRAGYTGSYALDLVVHDTIIAKPTGIFTFIWAKTDSGEWKIITGHLHSFSAH